MDRAGVEHVLRALGAGPVRVSGDNLSVPCPLARFTHEKRADRNPSFSIKVDPSGHSLCKCFACDFGGTLVGLLFELRRYGVEVPGLLEWASDAERVSFDGQLARANLEMRARFDKRVAPVEGPDFSVWNEAEMDRFKGAVPRYVLDRGIPLDTCRSWNLGYDRKGRRLVFPVRRKDGALVGMVGRTIDKVGYPVYKNYLNFRKSLYLYGENMACRDEAPDSRLPGVNGLVVVEGMLDVLWLWALGYRNVVGLFGSEASAEQISKILGYQRPVYLMLDWDKAGEKGRAKIAPRLEGRTVLLDVRGPEGKDPGDLSAEEIRNCVAEARFFGRMETVGKR